MVFRYARHTTDISKLIPFYVNILGLEILGEFRDHQTYNGVFFGKPHLNWHLEFTESPDEAQHHFDEDDLLVFYPETKEEYQKILQNIEKHQLKILSAKNPYWNENGTLIHDPDGFGIIISPLRIQ
jgi:catechol 2,3-dioxygenase-like lactoylglutathione lyase family enzyme